MYSHGLYNYQYGKEKSCRQTQAGRAKEKKETGFSVFQFRCIIAGFCLLFLSAAGSRCFAEPGLSLYGEIDSSLYTGLAKEREGISGYDTSLRIILEANPEPGIRFRAEGGYTLFYGLASDLGSAVAWGLASLPDPLSLPPDTDLHREFYIDQAYAAASFGAFEIGAGIIPVEWGSAYLYNPSSRTAAPVFPGSTQERAEGKPGLSAALSLPLGFLAEAYALTSPRLKAPLPELEELSPSNFPFGAKLILRSDYLDASAGIIREILFAGSDAKYWASADLSGFLGSIDWYAEAVLDVSGEKSGEDRGFEISAGFFYTLPQADITIRSEYFRLSGGGTDPNDYPTEAMLSGRTVLLATNYLFAGLEKEDKAAGRWKISCASLVNLDDLSAAFLAEGILRPSQIFEIGLFARLFTEELRDSGASEANREFGGYKTIGPGLGFRPYSSTAGVSMKWVF